MAAVSNTSSSSPSQALLNAVNPPKAAATDSVQAETDKFMTLLVTQLKNQDPMNPMDNAEMTSQLAQLSTVTGVNKLNSTLESLKTSYQSAEQLQATSLIRHGVLVPGDKMQLSTSKPATEDEKAITSAIFGFELQTPADTVEIVVRNSAGKVMHSETMKGVDAGVQALSWDGKLDGGEGTAKDGTYTLSITAKRGGETLKDAKPLSFDVVASVSTGSTGTKLNLLGQTDPITLGDVKQVL